MCKQRVIASLVVAAMVVAQPWLAQADEPSVGSHAWKLQRDHLKDLFGRDHPAVVKLDARIRRESHALIHSELAVVYTRIEDLEADAFRRYVVTLMSRIAKLEQEVSLLKKRVSELESSGQPANASSGAGLGRSAK